MLLRLLSTTPYIMQSPSCCTHSESECRGKPGHKHTTRGGKYQKPPLLIYRSLEKPPPLSSSAATTFRKIRYGGYRTRCNKMWVRTFETAASHSLPRGRQCMLYTAASHMADTPANTVPYTAASYAHGGHANKHNTAKQSGFFAPSPAGDSNTMTAT